MQVKAVKFGGTSLADAGQFRKVYEIVKNDTTRRFVVASAPGKRFSEDTKVTDMLYACYDMAAAGLDFSAFFAGICARFEAIVDGLGLDIDLSPDYEEIISALMHGAGRDYAASRGEYLAAKILAAYLGFDFIDAADVVFFRDDGSFDDAQTYPNFASVLRGHEYAVIPGFYGVMPNGTIKTFSRGGSDITGAIVARAADADIYENWTDVSGFLMADPRLIPSPLPIKTVTYRELRELSYMGAGVLHEDSVFPVRSAGIPINIRNTNEPDNPGTMIVSGTDCVDNEHIITGIAGRKNFSVIRIEKDRMAYHRGFLRRIFEVLDLNGINVDHIPSGIDTISVIVHSDELTGKYDILRESLVSSIKPDYLEIKDGLALIAVVGRGMVGKPGVASRIFDAVAAAHVNVRMMDQGLGELNVIVGVDEADFETALRAIYDAFVKQESNTL